MTEQRATVSHHFPPSVRQWLIEAARAPEGFEREKAIARAIEKAHLMFPEYFHPQRQEVEP